MVVPWYPASLLPLLGSRFPDPIPERVGTLAKAIAGYGAANYWPLMGKIKP